jgi:hypothetical protein
MNQSTTATVAADVAAVVLECIYMLSLKDDWPFYDINQCSDIATELVTHSPDDFLMRHLLSQL